jgi:hypothetical protein
MNKSKKQDLTPSEYDPHKMEENRFIKPTILIICLE